jgi:hypothetical protein
MADCNVDEILKKMRVLDNLKQMRTNLSTPELQTFTDFSDLAPKLDSIIAKQEADLQKSLDICGKIDVDEIPEAPAPEPEPEVAPEHYEIPEPDFNLPEV